MLSIMRHESLVELEKRRELEYVSCNICGSEYSKLYHKARSLYNDGEVFDVVRCRRCGLIYVNPRLAYKELFIRYHSRPNVLEGGTQDTFNRSLIEHSYMLAEIRIELIEDFLDTGRILDFGCGNGVFVYMALSRGWNAIGIDLNEGLIQAAEKYWRGEKLGGIWNFAFLDKASKLWDAAMRYKDTRRFYAISVDEFARENAGSFDVVNSSQTLEHLVNPSETVSNIVKLLKRGGLFVVDIPNIGSLKELLKRGSTLDPTAHFFYFSRLTVRKLFEKQGLEILSLSTRIHLLKLWIKLLSSIGFKEMVPRFYRAMEFIPDFGIGSDIIVVARKL